LNPLIFYTTGEHTHTASIDSNLPIIPIYEVTFPQGIEKAGKRSAGAAAVQTGAGKVNYLFSRFIYPGVGTLKEINATLSCGKTDRLINMALMGLCRKKTPEN